MCVKINLQFVVMVRFPHIHQMRDLKKELIYYRRNDFIIPPLCLLKSAAQYYYLIVKLDEMRCNQTEDIRKSYLISNLMNF